MFALKRVLLAIAAVALAAPAGAQVGGYEDDMFVKAIREGNNTDALKLLEAKPSLVNARDVTGKTALITAIENRDQEWVAHLLREGANPNQSLKNGDSPLITAARLGLQDVASWLVGVGARVDETNRMGETALIVAVQQRHVPVVRILLDAGADPDRTDAAAGYSARDYAKRDSRTPDLLRLIEAKKPAP
jgi:ankyrin repeat protein